MRTRDGGNVMAKRRAKLVGKGTDFRGQKRIVIGFDPDTFEEIRDRAVKQRVSFGEAARQLVEWGLMDAESDE